jgi:hypothetical protein
MAERCAGFRPVVRTDGVDGVMAIAEEVASALDRLAAEDKALAAIGGEVGFCLGYATATREHTARIAVDTRGSAFVH